MAYGVLTLEERVPQLDRAARRRLEDLAYDAVARIGGRAGKPAFTTQFAAIAEAGIDMASFLPRVLAEVTSPDGLDLDGVPDPITNTVLPNLLRVGLVPERQMDGYLAQGWRIEPGGSEVTDLHSWHPEARAARERISERGGDLADPAAFA